MIKTLVLILCSVLTACSTTPYTISDRDFYFHLELVKSFPNSYQHGLAQWDGQQCWVTLIKDQYPMCLQHEVRHCIEGKWHTEKWNNDDCFY